MSQLTGTEFDLYENEFDATNNNVDLFNDVPDVEEVSLEFLTDFAIYSDIEKDVVNKHEIPAIFDKFNDLETSSSVHKMVLSNLFGFACSSACDRIRTCAKTDIKAIYGDCASFFRPSHGIISIVRLCQGTILLILASRVK
jgi:hypothetical protein